MTNLDTCPHCGAKRVGTDACGPVRYACGFSYRNPDEARRLIREEEERRKRKIVRPIGGAAQLTDLIKRAIFEIATELDQLDAPPAISFVPYHAMNAAHQRAWRLAIAAVRDAVLADQAADPGAWRDRALKEMAVTILGYQELVGEFIHPHDEAHTEAICETQQHLGEFALDIIERVPEGGHQAVLDWIAAPADGDGGA